MIKHTWFRSTLAATAVAVVAACSSSNDPETLILAYSNDMNGEIRSCGCAAKDFGGLGRRATFVNMLRDSTGSLLLVDGGDMFGTKLNYGKEKADLTLKSMSLMEYDGIVVGETEFGFGVDFIVRRTQELHTPVVLANLYYGETDTLLFPPSRVVKKGNGIQVGLIGVMSRGIKFPPQVEQGRLRVTDPVEAVLREIEALGDDVDLIVVLAHMQRKAAQALAIAVPEVDLIVHGHEGRAVRRIRKHGNAYVLQVADRGRYLGAATVTLSPDRTIASLTSHVTALDKWLDDDEAVSQLFRAYDMRVAAKEKSNIPPGLFEARLGLKKPFAGSQPCQPCHLEVFDQWSGTPHAHAMEVLLSQSREYDRDCTPCHTTGFYKRGGFESFSVTPDLINVGCEACHGNGHDHVLDPKVKTDADAARTCRGCHTVDQTPDFVFETFWERIKH